MSLSKQQNHQGVMPSNPSDSFLSSLPNHAKFLLNLSRAGGDVVDYLSPEGKPVFLVNDPKLAKSVLRNSESLYANPHHQYAVLAPLLTEEGMLLLHLRRQDSRDTAVDEVLESLHQRLNRSFPDLEKQLRKPITEISNTTDVTPILKAYSLQVMAATLFDVDISPFTQDFVAALDYMELGHLPYSRPSVASMTKEKANETQQQVASFIARTAVIRKEGKEVRLPPPEWNSLVTAVLRTLINAYNALAVSTSWSLRLLAQHPVWQARLATEAQQTFDRQTTPAKKMACLKNTRLVVQESLRLYPPAWVLGRYARRPHQLGGMQIPIHSRVSVSPYAMHRLPAYWDSPSTFQPSRFDVSCNASRKAYFPFGGGARICPAAKLSLELLQSLLAALVKRFHFETVPHSLPMPYGATSLLPYPHNILRYEPRDESKSVLAAGVPAEALEIS